jgi:hypothetical protein
VGRPVDEVATVLCVVRVADRPGQQAQLGDHGRQPAPFQSFRGSDFPEQTIE